jgi:DNA polymerase III subunit beta
MTEILANGADLAEAAQWAARLAPSRTANPIMQGVLVEADEDPEQVRLTGSDTFTTGVYTLSAAVLSAGRVLIPGRLLAAIAKNLPKRADVRLTVTERGVTVTAGRDTWESPALPLDVWPELPVGRDVLGEVDGPQLRAALARVLPAADQSHVGPLYGAIQFDLDAEGRLVIAATDRYRAAWATLAWQPALPARHGHLAAVPDLDVGPWPFLVPGKFVEHATHQIGAETAAVRLLLSGHTLTLAGDRQRLTDRLVAQEWPPWRGCIPAAADSTATVVLGELSAALERILAVAEDRGPRPMRLSITDEGVELATVVDDRRACAHCPVTLDGAPKTLAVNAQYLRDSLGTLHSDVVDIWLGPKEQSPLMFVPLDDDGKPADDYRHILMPLKMREVAGV